MGRPKQHFYSGTTFSDTKGVGLRTQPILQMCGKHIHQQKRMCNYMAVNHLKYQI